MATMKGSSAILVILSALVLLHIPTAAAFKPIDIMPPTVRTPAWEAILNELFSHFNGCDGVARAWWRVTYHDCGTYDKNTGTGGCDGSLRFPEELIRPENSHPTIAETIHTYEAIIKGKNVSMADTIIAGGMLGLAVCNGPVIMFVPGRRDATVPNMAGLIPRGFDGLDRVMAAMDRMSFRPGQSVALIGAGHTIAALSFAMDGTPETFDNKFFVELNNRANQGSKLTSDLVMLENKTMKMWIGRFARDEPEFMTQAVKAIQKMIRLVPRRNALGANAAVSSKTASD